MRVPRFGSLPDDVPWAAAARAGHASGQIRGQPPVERRRVLLVERDAMLGFALLGVLEGHYDVELARDATRALHVLATSRFDAILADDTPGSGGGVELLREVRRRHPRVRRLLMTRDDASSIPGEEGLWEGVLQKPFELDDLLELLRAIEPVPSSRSAAIC